MNGLMASHSHTHRATVRLNVLSVGQRHHSNKHDKWSDEKGKASVASGTISEPSWWPVGSPVES